MRLLIITQYFWPENFRINDLTSELASRGHKVTVLTGTPNYPSGSIFKEFKTEPDSFSKYNGSKIIRVPIIPRGKNNLQLFFNYLSFILTASSFGLYRLKGHEFDAVFVFQPSPITTCLPAILYRYFKRVPVAFWVLDLWPDSLKAIGIVRSNSILWLLKGLVKFIYNRVDLILGQSKSFLPNIQKHCKHKNIRYFPGWAESVFHKDLKAINSLNKISNSFNITFAGNIGESQDFPAILDAAEILKNNLTIRWTIIGDGRMFGWVKDEVNRRGLSEKVLLIGKKPIHEMPKYFNEADALLVSLKAEPIFSYTIPGKFQSYLKAGKPIIAMLNGECHNIVKANKCGIAVKAGDSIGLSNSIIKIMQMPSNSIKEMGNNSLNLSNTEFDRKKLINQLENWLKQLSDKNPLYP